MRPTSQPKFWPKKPVTKVGGKKTVGRIVSCSTVAFCRTLTLVCSTLLGVGMLILISQSLFWLFAALGIGTQNPETIQSTTPVFFLFLFVSNAFIPVTTLLRWLQGFAANQPVSVFDNTLRP
jgi:hypothetical protein